LNDSSFSDSLYGYVDLWVKSIQNVKKLSRGVVSGPSSQEINLWPSLERALDGVEVQLMSDEDGDLLSAICQRVRATVGSLRIQD
jgi:dynein heavy chain 1